MSTGGWFKRIFSPSKDEVVPEPVVTPEMPKVKKPRAPRKPKATPESNLAKIMALEELGFSKLEAEEMLAKQAAQEKQPKKKPAAPTTSSNPEKDAATARGEPWVSVAGIDLDLDNLRSGSFNLDWNDIFIAKLVRSGYKGKTDIDLVDQWFSDICRDVISENYEQWQSDPTNRNQ